MGSACSNHGVAVTEPIAFEVRQRSTGPIPVAFEVAVRDSWPSHNGCCVSCPACSGASGFWLLDGCIGRSSQVCSGI